MANSANSRHAAARPPGTGVWRAVFGLTAVAVLAWLFLWLGGFLSAPREVLGIRALVDADGREANGGQAQNRQPAQGRPQGGQNGGGGDRGGPAGGGPPGQRVTRTDEQILVRRKDRLDQSSPEERARSAEYRRAMTVRRDQLGISPGRGRGA